MTIRRRLTRVEKEAILDRQRPESGGDPICALCPRPMTGSVPIEFDHALALGLGGADDPDNIAAAHAPCHRKKTSEDVRKMAKSDAMGGRTGQRARRLTSNWKRSFPKRIDPWGKGV